MPTFGFSLADRLGARSFPCSVQGCARTWLAMPGKALKLGGRPEPTPEDPSSSMCDPCRDRFRQLEDQARPCDRPGCQGTWSWNAMSQLEAFATRRAPPKNLCGECEARLATLEDRQVPCAVPGCERTGTLTRRAQLLAGTSDAEAQPAGAQPAATFCGPCEQVSRKLKDRKVSCAVRGCRGKWTWTTEEQIRAFAAGLPNEPPRRLCESCDTFYGAVADREVRCRTSGCKNTWTWSREAQIDSCTAGKPLPKAPARMCKACLDLYSRLQDVERPCRRSTCKRTWTDKRGAQLARLVRGKSSDPYPRHCAECEKELGELEDRQIACKTENCPGTWTWSKGQQLAAGVRPPGAEAAEPERPKRRRRQARPPDRHCEACAEFLADRKTRELPCLQCATPIYWPPESQLQTHLGNWAEPTLCGACKRDAIEAARVVARQALRQPGAHAQPPQNGTAEGSASPGADAAAEPAGDNPQAGH